jgi:prepilin-type N-terminal cleavage/methylation domain-containing protein
MTSQAVGPSRTACGESIDGELDVDITDGTRDQEGFSLVEVLIAVIVLSFGLLAVGGLALATAQQSRASEARTDQTLAAERVMDGLVSQGYTGLDDETGAGEVERDVQIGERTVPVASEVTQVSGGLREIRVVARRVDVVPPDTLVMRVAR